MLSNSTQSKTEYMLMVEEKRLFVDCPFYPVSRHGRLTHIKPAPVGRSGDSNRTQDHDEIHSL